MNSTPAHVTQMLDELKRRFASKIAEARKFLDAINTIEEEHSLPKTAFNESGISISVGDKIPLSDSQSNATRSVAPLRGDEYLGEDPLRAAKKFIKRMGQAMTFDDIADAVMRGGAAVKGSDWKNKLETGLIRSTADVVKVRNGLFGLTEFYSEEQLKNFRQARRSAASVPGRKRGRPPKKQGKGATEIKALPPRKGSEGFPKEAAE